MDGHRHPTIRHTVSLSSAAYLGRLLHIFPPSLSLSSRSPTRECWSGYRGKLYKHEGWPRYYPVIPVFYMLWECAGWPVTRATFNLTLLLVYRGSIHIWKSPPTTTHGSRASFCINFTSRNTSRLDDDLLHHPLRDAINLYSTGLLFGCLSDYYIILLEEERGGR